MFTLSRSTLQWYRATTPTCKCRCMLRCLSVLPEGADDPSIRRMRLVKRIFGVVLFGGTFMTALFMRRRKLEKLREVLKDCERLPSDYNFQVSSELDWYRYKGCVLPGQVIRGGVMQDISKFEAHETDVIVASYPKSGTTWIQEIVWMIFHGLEPSSSDSQLLETRFPYLESPYPGLGTVNKRQHHRFIKTHLPLWLLPPSVFDHKTKVIYICRNPKDVAVSYYHFLRMMTWTNYRGTFDEFLDKFMKDQVPYSPFFRHIRSYWEQRVEAGGEVLWVTYEDLKKDPGAVITRIGEFLDHPLTEEQVKYVGHHTSFSNMAANPSTNYSHWDDLALRNKTESHFFRKGQVGDWKNYFTEDSDRRFTRWIDEQLKGSDLGFGFESAEGNA